MTTQVNDVFRLALEKRKQLESEQKTVGQSFENFIQLETVGLEQGVEKVGRIVGVPIEVRSTPFDPKLLLVSYIVRQDKKGYHKVIWKHTIKNGYYVPDEDWILTKLYNKVMSGKWINYSEGILKDKDGHVYPPDYVNAKGKKGEWKRFYENTQIYKIIESNSKVNERYPKNFYPSKRIVLNWIDRHDSWCEDNKHTKLLVSKKTPYEFIDEKHEKHTIYYQDIGIPFELYNKIFEHVMTAGGTFDIDLVITKKDKDYVVFDITDYPKYISENSFKIGKKSPMTKDELNYEKYDLDSIYKVTSYRSLRKNLRYLFELADKELGTTFMQELDRLCIEEEQNFVKSDVNDDINEMAEDIISTIDSIEPQKIETSTIVINNSQPTVSKRNVRQVNSQKDKNFEIIDYCQKLPHWKSLSKEEQKIFISMIDDIIDGVPKFIIDDVPACANENCKFPNTESYTLVPTEINVCPVCGISFE